MRRVLVLGLLGLGIVLISGSWAQLLMIGAAPVDLVMLAVVAFAVIDSSQSPILFAAYTGLLVDIMYSTTVGLGALATTGACAVVFFAVRRADHIHLLIVIAAGAAGYLIKNLILAIYIYASGMAPVSASVFTTAILPGTGIAAGLIIPAYWLMTRLMRLRFMRRRRILVDEF